MIRFVIDYMVMTLITLVIGFYVLESTIKIDKTIVGKFSQHVDEVLHD